MQAYKAYYDEGKFILFDHAEIQKGSQAIITVLDFPIEYANNNKPNVRQKKALKKFREAIRSSEPLPPEFDEVINQRVNITRELDL